MKRKVLIGITLVLALAMVISCTNLRKGLEKMQTSSKARYYVALDGFVDFTREYNIEYENASSEVQAELKADVDPLIIAADAALDVWKTSIDDGTVSGEQEDSWKAAAEAIVSALLGHGIEIALSY
jgi:hypothetical protein